MSPASDKTERPSTLSRNVAIASGGAIALLVAYLALEASKEASPATIEFEIAAAEGWTHGSTTYVPVDVRNTGGETAAEIEIETVFEVQGDEPIVKRTIIDFLAGGERKRLYVAGPPGASLATRVIGFQDP